MSSDLPPAPRPTETPAWFVSAFLFERALAIVYGIAFVSFGIQAAGLIGSRGILPVSSFLETARQEFGGAAYWYFPTVLWLWSSDTALLLLWLTGAAAAILVALGYLRRPLLALLLVLYLSVCVAGQDFLSFQWDALLVEAGFLALFLDGTRARTWPFRWLVFRLMFLSGAVKLLSGDPSWRNLTALHFHYETQPLPNPVAWYMFQLPMGFQKFSTALALGVELVLPFLVFAPRRGRLTAFAGLTGLQVLILLTGNYAFFNLLALALCLFLIDDALWPASLVRRWRPAVPPAGALHRTVSRVLIAAVATLGGGLLLETLTVAPPAPVARLDALLSPFRLVNSYGLFAVMTTTRPEILVQGSDDGVNWRDYEFRFKPGDPRRAPPVVAPYQPRLDWQMWFAALGNRVQNPWFSNFLARLLEGSPPVLALLRDNPFPSRPPRYVRAVLFDYAFTGFAERRATGAWWRRRRTGLYFPPSGLSSKSQRDP